MVAVSITGFQGQAPRIDRHLLANNQSAGSTNVDLRAGRVDPLRRPVELIPSGENTDVALLSGSRAAAKRLFKLLTTTSDPLWVLSPDPNAHLCRSPGSNDSHERVYWTESGSIPRMNTMARLEAGNPSYALGLPAPAALSVSVVGGSGASITRTYVCTYLTTYGEEGPPSPATTVTGFENGDWQVTGYPTSDTDPDRPLLALRFYRSELTTGVLRYLRSETFPAPATFSDTTGEVLLSSRGQLVSLNWQAPPATLQGLTVHPNGFLMGFSGRDVYFSEPYLPHAWPPGYTLRVQHDIVALAVFGDYVAVLTKGPPVILVGALPLDMTAERLGQPSPCLAARSVVVDGAYVYYATTDGLARLSGGGVEVISKEFVTKENWIANWYTDDMRAILWDGYYMALTTENRGFLFSPVPPASGFIQIALPKQRQGIDVAPDTGEAMMLCDGAIERWMPADVVSGFLRWAWTSKTFHFGKPVNLGAVQVRLKDDDYGGVNELSPEQEAMLAYNAERIAAGPLDCLNLYALGGQASIGVAPGGVAARPPCQPLGGEPLYEPYRGTGVLLRVYARDVLQWEQQIEGEHTRRLPSGIKSNRWWFELEGQNSVLALHAAETGKELANV